jgi:hypothetical protein
MARNGEKQRAHPKMMRSRFMIKSFLWRLRQLHRQGFLRPLKRRLVAESVHATTDAFSACAVTSWARR